MAGAVAMVLLIYLASRYAKSMKFSRLNDWIVYRSGIFTRKFSVTFFDKVQAVSILQSPFDRRWDMSTLSVDTAAAGPAQHRIEVKYLPTSIADDELIQIADGAARHRLTGLR
jgi:putative membrane protein